MTRRNCFCGEPMDGVHDNHDARAMGGPTYTRDECRRIAAESGVPGPDVTEHPAGYDGECYCAECLAYATQD